MAGFCTPVATNARVSDFSLLPGERHNGKSSPMLSGSLLVSFCAHQPFPPDALSPFFDRAFLP